MTKNTLRLDATASGSTKRASQATQFDATEECGSAKRVEPQTQHPPHLQASSCRARRNSIFNSNTAHQHPPGFITTIRPHDPPTNLYFPRYLSNHQSLHNTTASSWPREKQRERCSRRRRTVCRGVLLATLEARKLICIHNIVTEQLDKELPEITALAKVPNDSLHGPLRPKS
jgi:hypothetical protein